MEERSQHRREEKEWLAERTSLSRRLQLLDRLGLDRLQAAGHKTEGRLESRSDQKIYGGYMPIFLLFIILCYFERASDTWELH